MLTIKSDINNIEIYDESIQNVIVDLNNKIKILENENQQLKNKIINIQTNLNSVKNIIQKISTW